MPPSRASPCTAKRSRAWIREDGITIIASGPLTSSALSQEIARLTGSEHLAFYDSISPIVEADSIDREKVYLAARYDKGTADYINCPMTKDEYEAFLDALLAAESVEAKEWEKLDYFRGLSAHRGAGAPRSGHAPLRPDEAGGSARSRGPAKYPGRWCSCGWRTCASDSYNLVGFQNHMKYGEQARIFRMIPGLENAKFLRYGQIHRNTYINAPGVLNRFLQMKEHPGIFFAGQISGVEGYTESIATGMLAGLYAAAIARGETPEPVPRGTALGSLVRYVTEADPKRFQPANITFDLLEPLDEETRRKVRDKRERHRIQCERALADFDPWLNGSGDRRQQRQRSAWGSDFSLDLLTLRQT